MNDFINLNISERKAPSGAIKQLINRIFHLIAFTNWLGIGHLFLLIIEILSYAWKFSIDSSVDENICFQVQQSFLTYRLRFFCHRSTLLGLFEVSNVTGFLQIFPKILKAMVVVRGFKGNQRFSRYLSRLATFPRKAMFDRDKPSSWHKDKV